LLLDYTRQANADIVMEHGFVLDFFGGQLTDRQGVLVDSAYVVELFEE